MEWKLRNWNNGVESLQEAGTRSCSQLVEEICGLIMDIPEMEIGMSKKGMEELVIDHANVRTLKLATKVINVLNSV